MESLAVRQKQKHPATTEKKVGDQVKRNLAGLRFGLITVVRYLKCHDRSGKIWLCRCNCGKEFLTQSNKLTSGHSRSCGCKLIKHGHSSNRTPEYRTWCAMNNRCLNPNNTAYRYYGGRGIKVCRGWQLSYARFLRDMGARPKGKTLDRINNNGNYKPSNCRWANSQQQQSNRRCNRIIEFNGIKQSVTAWAREKQISPHLLFGRLDSGFLVDANFFNPKRQKPRFRKIADQSARLKP